MLVDESKVQSVLSAKQQGSYQSHAGQQIVSFLAIIIFTSLISLIIASSQMIFESAKQRRLRMRRLRYRSDNTEAHEPALQEGERYHLFLSHAWSDSGGQAQMRSKCPSITPLPSTRNFDGATASR